MLSRYFFQDSYYRCIKGEIPLSRQCFYNEVNGLPLIFIHIPKTAGTSLAKALAMPPPSSLLQFGLKKHVTAEEAREIVGPVLWNDALKIACVRNPWQRLYSFWVYRLQMKEMSEKKLELDFQSWANRVLNRPDLRDLRSQCQWLGGAQHINDFDLILKFESLPSDIQKLESLLGITIKLPHLLNTNSGESYIENYSDELCELVASKYHDDIERFEYSF